MTAPDPVLVAAYEAGRTAFAADLPSTSCPHPADSDERLVWVKGYVQARTDAGARVPRLPQEA